jgi:hypothetical protein
MAYSPTSPAGELFRCPGNIFTVVRIPRCHEFLLRRLAIGSSDKRILSIGAETGRKIVVIFSNARVAMIEKRACEMRMVAPIAGCTKAIEKLSKATWAYGKSIKSGGRF